MPSTSVPLLLPGPSPRRSHKFEPVAETPKKYQSSRPKGREISTIGTGAVNVAHPLVPGQGPGRDHAPGHALGDTAKIEAGRAVPYGHVPLVQDGSATAGAQTKALATKATVEIPGVRMTRTGIRHGTVNSDVGNRRIATTRCRGVINLHTDP